MFHLQKRFTLHVRLKINEEVMEVFINKYSNDFPIIEVNERIFYLNVFNKLRNRLIII